LDIAAAGTRPVRRLALDTERSFLLSERREALLRTDGARGWFDTFSGLAGGMDLLVIPVRRERALLGIGMLVGPRALFDDATVGALVTATNAAFAAFARVRPACAGDGDRRPRLTPREKSILDLMANGLSEEEVAATLGLSRRTVSFHLDEARARLGDEVRRFAVDIARERARRR
jgi:DNA-binding CsgD family transcriptional regulator